MFTLTQLPLRGKRAGLQVKRGDRPKKIRVSALLRWPARVGFGRSGSERSWPITLDERVCVVDTSCYQVCLEREFLTRKQGKFGFKALIPAQGNLDRVLPGGHQHPVTEAVELTDVTHEIAVQENRRSLRPHIQSYFSPRFLFRKLKPGVPLHYRVDLQCHSRLDGDLSVEIAIPGLPDQDFMLAGQKLECRRSLQLAQEADVLPIDPYS